MIDSHSILAPSSSPEWVFCPGSVQLQRDEDDSGTQKAMEGTASHWIGEQVLRNYTIPDQSVLISEDFIGKQAPNGIEMDSEMWEASKIYIGDVLTTANARGLLSKLQIEDRLVMPEVHDECWGTADCWAFDEGKRVLYVWDYKYGHRGVIGFENWQMILYALGALRRVTADKPLGDYGITVVIRVVQPRCWDGNEAVREWVIPAVDLRPYVNILHASAHAAESANAPTLTGDHCRDCKAAHKCPSLLAATAHAIDHSGDAIPVNLTESALAYELDKIAMAQKVMKARREALEVDAENRIRTGTLLPGYALKQNYGNNSWDNNESVSSLGSLMNVDLMDPPKPVTPAEAGRRLKANGMDPSIIESMYSRKPSSMKLIADDGTKARQLFSKGGM